jgi:hypothetical protein
LSTGLHKSNNDNNKMKNRFKIEERRMQVATLLAQSITERNSKEAKPRPDHLFLLVNINGKRLTF